MLLFHPRGPKTLLRKGVSCMMTARAPTCTNAAKSEDFTVERVRWSGDLTAHERKLVKTVIAPCCCRSTRSGDHTAQGRHGTALSTVLECIPCKCCKWPKAVMLENGRAAGPWGRDFGRGLDVDRAVCPWGPDLEDGRAARPWGRGRPQMAP